MIIRPDQIVGHLNDTNSVYAPGDLVSGLTNNPASI